MAGSDFAAPSAAPSGSAQEMEAQRDTDEPIIWYDELSEDDSAWTVPKEYWYDADFYAKITIDGPLPDLLAREAALRIDDFTFMVPRRMVRDFARLDDSDISIELQDEDAEYAIVHWSP